MMKTPGGKSGTILPALYRLIASLPLLAILLTASSLPTLILCFAEKLPELAFRLDSLQPYAVPAAVASSALLMLLHAPIYIRGLTGLFTRLPDTESLIAIGTLATFIIGVLPVVMGFFPSTSPQYAGIMSASLAFGSLGVGTMSYFDITGLTIVFASLGEFLTSRILALCDDSSRTHFAADSGTKYSDVTRPMTTSRAHVAADSGHKSPGESHIKKVDAASPRPEETGTPHTKNTKAVAGISSLSGHAVIFALSLAALVAVVWILLGVSLPFAAGFALMTVAISCPVVVGISSTLPLWAGFERCAKLGFVMRDVDSFVTASKVSAVVFEKRGIVTLGKPEITNVIPSGITGQALLALAAAAESGSYHPLARAISERAIRERARFSRLAAFNEIRGSGVEVLMNGAAIRVGKRAWLEGEGVRLGASLLTKADQLTGRGRSVVFVSSWRDGKGIIAFEDDVRQGFSEAVRTLKDRGIKPVIVTGDSLRAAKNALKGTSADDIRADFTDDDAAAMIRDMKSQGSVVAFVGRDSDSAPAREADLFMGFYKDSDVVIKGLSAILDSFSFTKKTIALARKSLLIALWGALLALPAASGIFFTFGGTMPSPIIFVLAALPGFFAALVSALSLAFLDKI